MKTDSQILRLNLAGVPIDWISWKDAVTLQARNLVVWTLGEPFLTVFGGTSRSTGKKSKMVIHPIMACQGRIFDNQKKHPNLTNKALFRRDRHMCMYCGKKSAESNLTRDHLIPLSRGGKDRWQNVVSACRRCNQHKGNKLLSEIGIELIALPYIPNHAEYLALTNSHRIRTDQMDFLEPSFSRNSRFNR